MIDDVIVGYMTNSLYYLLDSTESENDSPFIFLDNSDTEEDGDGESEDDQDYWEG